MKKYYQRYIEIDKDDEIINTENDSNIIELNNEDIKMRGMAMRKFNIKKINKTNIKLTVIRVNKSNKLKSSEPCVDCAKVFKVCLILGITIDIYHSDSNENIVEYNGQSTLKCFTHYY